MPLFRRAPHVLPMPFPRLDGSSWPDGGASGRASFAVAALYEMAQEEAFTAAAHGVTDLVVLELLPRLWTGAAVEDEAYMQRVCVAAAQLGAGIGILEHRSVHSGAGTAREVAGVLWLAAAGLPSMPPHQRAVARYLLQCGYHLARTGPDGLPELVAALVQEDHPAVRRTS
jgi:hypothetical protein